MTTGTSREKTMQLSEIVDKQNSIISMQAGIINELFQLLSMHIDAEELDSLPVVSKINAAAEIREELMR